MRDMTRKISPALAALGLAATLVLSGCGSDSGGDTATDTGTSGGQLAGDDTIANDGDPSGGADAPPPEAPDMVSISIGVAEQITNYVNTTLPGGTSAEVTAELVDAGPVLVTDARELSTADAVVLTIAANQSDLNFPGQYEMVPIDGFLVVDVLFESEYSCSVSIPNVATTPGTVKLEFDAATAATSGSVRCGR